MSIRQTHSVLLLERRGDTTIAHDALVIGLTMDTSLIGKKGEPAAELVYANAEALRHGGTADWHHALMRAGNVVHKSHDDWEDGRTAFAWEQVDPSAPLNTFDLVQVAARAAHEANRIVCVMAGDQSQQFWVDAPDWQKLSARAGVLHIQNNPGTTPEESHELWMAAKLADGWQYGPVKDAGAKTHPALRPYRELPVVQQIKDWMFGAVVRGVLDLPQMSTVPLPLLEPAAPAIAEVPEPEPATV